MAKKKKEIVNEVVSAETVENAVSEAVEKIESETDVTIENTVIGFIEKPNDEEIIAVIPVADEKVTEEYTNETPTLNTVEETKENTPRKKVKYRIGDADNVGFKPLQYRKPIPQINYPFEYTWNGQTNSY